MSHGTWGMRGLKDRALELPEGSGVAVSQADRARLRYNETKRQMEQSINGGDWTPMSTVTSDDIRAQDAWYIDSVNGDDANDGISSD